MTTPFEQALIEHESWQEYEARRVARDTAERLAKVETACPGQPATMSIGSDSYAYIVERVECFKTGDRAGQVRSVFASRAEFIGDKLFGTGADLQEFKVDKRGYLRNNKYRTLWLGEARTYLDPHF